MLIAQTMTKIRNYYKVLFLITLFYSSSFYSLSTLGSEPVILKPLVIEKVQLDNSFLTPGENTKLQIKIQLAKGHYAYADQFKLEIASAYDIKHGRLDIQPLVEFYDKFSKKTKTGIEGSATITTSIEFPEDMKSGEYNLNLSLEYQACTATYCHLPKIAEKVLSFDIKSAVKSTSGSPHIDTENLSPFEKAKNKGGLTLLFFVFLAGILTSFTPCIFPMIPITLAVLKGKAQSKGKLEGFLRSWAYVLGISLTYTVLGLFAALTGSLFGSLLSHPIVIIVLSSIFMLMAFSMFGFYELRPPKSVERYLNKKGESSNFGGIFITGTIAGIVASPCVGPVLVSVLTFVAKSQDILLGGLLLFVYSLGFGLLFVVIGTFSQAAQRKLPKSGKWMTAIKDILGWLMVALAFYYLKPVISPTYWTLLLGFTLVSLSSVFGAFAEIKPGDSWLYLKKGWMLVVYIFGVYLLLSIIMNRSTNPINTESNKEISKQTSSIAWQEYSPQAFSLASDQGKGVIIDFYADWCLSCVELENLTFNQPEVQALKNKFIWIKYDATKSSKKFEELTKKYEIYGLPHVVFYSSTGKWRKDLTLTGFEKASEFAVRMKTALNPDETN